MHQSLPILVRGKLKPGGIYIEFCVDHNGTLSSAVLTHPPAPAKRDPFLGNPAPSCIPPTYPPSPPQVREVSCAAVRQLFITFGVMGPWPAVEVMLSSAT